MAHILIADDDDLVTTILAEAFAEAGHPSHAVASAEAAWESVHARRPDLLLLDRDMPGMPGLALLAKLRASPLFYDLPVVILTALRDELDEDAAIRAGAQDFLRKPFDPDALVARVETALARKVEARPFSGAYAEIAEEGDFPASAAYWQRYLPSPRRA
ncbi:response regulator [Erythrobacter sp.]|uniref:response regulator transcription factor n=1 Tax=Erythrobacter sp. TaxID=1042 RepID=UPI001425CE8E|nr:response regulator [Erythrobacter sp.]QIQ86328.1 MAG: response regulator [Erythrobacter sp.]